MDPGDILIWLAIGAVAGWLAGQLISRVRRLKRALAQRLRSGRNLQGRRHKTAWNWHRQKPFQRLSA
jgi:hypothetical protein